MGSSILAAYGSSE